MVSTAWGSRYQKIISKFKKEADLLYKLLLEVNKLANEVKVPVKKRLLTKLSSVNDIGKSDTYDTRKFDFGIKRIMRTSIWFISSKNFRITAKGSCFSSSFKRTGRL
jgi:hypothetical protein